MIGYVTIGVKDVERARSFYDALLGEIGAKRLMELPGDPRGFTMYGVDWSKPAVVITKPFNDGEAHPGNGNMVGLAVDDRAHVDQLHAKALELGGSDEGAPGVRPPEEMGFYGAYWRDPDGNKFCAFKVG